MQAKRNVKGLIKALTYEEDSSVRQAAARALGQIGDVRAVEPLIAALKNSKIVVGQAAAGALGQIGDARAVEPLIAALKGKKYDVCKAAVAALAKIGVLALEPLIAALKDSRWDVREAVAGVLGEIGDARAAEPLIFALNDSDNNVRKAAVGALGQIGDVRSIEPLIAALSRYDVRKAAVDALGQLGDAHAIEPLMVALKDSDKNVRKAAVAALDKIGLRPGQDECAATYWVVKEEWNKCIEIGAPAVGPLIAVLGDNRVRTSAAYALVEIGAPAVEPLIAELKVGNNCSRMEARNALDKIGWRPGRDECAATYWVGKEEWNKCIEIGAPAVGPLIAALKDLRDYRVSRSGVCVALVKIGAPAVEPLIAALKYSQMISREECRAAAKVVEKDDPEPADTFSYMFRTVAGVLGEIGDARAVEWLVAGSRDEQLNGDLRNATTVALHKFTRG
jgi:HEAT repeat protein